MLKQDFVMRIIEKAMQAIARALGYQAKGEDTRALEALSEAYLDLLRVDRQTFETLDIKTLVTLLGPPEVVRTLARVMTIEARTFERMDRPYLAKQRRTRATELYLAVGVGDDAEDLAALRELHAWLKQQRD
ncbi:MAG: hypothetical protein H6718_20515 [Polyangiaceae bacterium]|nr:hypothetical protein [Myxococcales bacterium]MCB9587799.1 hypothetical protein [Polyangiaceae bacterium]MCB9608748.1 hypothetical protein [Polyangiaceae bacterium]